MGVCLKKMVMCRAPGYQHFGTVHILVKGQLSFLSGFILFQRDGEGESCSTNCSSQLVMTKCLFEHQPEEVSLGLDHTQLLA